MNRAEFMAALEAQLRDITTEERDEALKFYNEYLDEAGPENEAAVLAELRRIEAGQGVNDELLDTIQMIATIMNGMQEDFAYDR